MSVNYTEFQRLGTKKKKKEKNKEKKKKLESEAFH